MDYKKSYSIFNISLYVAVALCMVAMSTGLSFLAFVGLGLFALGGLQAKFFYRCPHCHASLHILKRKPDTCPECGEEFLF